jgi:hypothetical protein
VILGVVFLHEAVNEKVDAGESQALGMPEQLWECLVSREPNRIIFVGDTYKSEPFSN